LEGIVPRRSSRSRAVGVRPSSAPSFASCATSSSLVANRRGINPAARFAAFQVPKCSITVCGCIPASGSAANSFMVGERPSRSADARSASRICSSLYLRRIPAWNAARASGSIRATAR
jgi:hypothetical protein